MRKCYFYGIQGEITPTGPREILARFRTVAERDRWVMEAWGEDAQQVYNYMRSAQVEQIALLPKSPVLTTPTSQNEIIATMWAAEKDIMDTLQMEYRNIPTMTRFAVPGSHPEVRRIKRRISQGEAVVFPVDVGA